VTASTARRGRYALAAIAAVAALAIAVVFTLPEQNLQEILNQGGANGGLKVFALDRGNTSTLDEGALAVVDNEIDQTTGTLKLKATFPNDQLQLWPGKFVNARLILTTRKGATVVPSSVVQRGPHSELVQQEGSIYAKLYASWLEQTR